MLHATPPAEPDMPAPAPDALTPAPGALAAMPQSSSAAQTPAAGAPEHKRTGQAPQPAPFCLASACLCGLACRWDGRAAPLERLVELYRQGLALAVCPEVDGGLPVPRMPCELRGGRALSRDGRDLTPQFTAGAAQALQLAREHNIRLAVLKERSPSCGGTEIYDGSFSGRRVPGKGITAALLEAHGIRVVNEDGFAALLP